MSRTCKRGHVGATRTKQGACTECKSAYPRKKKPRIRHSEDGVRRCESCGETKELLLFGKVGGPAAGQRGKRCMDCLKEARKRTSREANKKHYRKNPEAARAAALRRDHDMDEADYQRLLDRQGGTCALCTATTTNVSKQKLSVDHCHVTGHVRGLLCGRHNIAAGLLRDRPYEARALAVYLERTRIEAEVAGLVYPQPPLSEWGAEPLTDAQRRERDEERKSEFMYDEYGPSGGR